jgi:hypothetical protein
MRSAESIQKQKETLAANKAREIERQKKREDRKLARTVGLRTPIPPAPTRSAALVIDVDWNGLPMQDAKNLYSELQRQYEAAGKILNARAMTEGTSEFYECFMAGKDKCCPKGNKYRMPPRGQDYENGVKDPRTGLVTPVRICSENCWIRFQDLLIKARRDRFLNEGN